MVQQPVSGPVHGDPSHGGCFLQDAVSQRGLSAKPAWLQRGRRRLPDKHPLVTNAFVQIFGEDPQKPASGHQTTCASGDEWCEEDVCS